LGEDDGVDDDAYEEEDVGDAGFTVLTIL